MLNLFRSGALSRARVRRPRHARPAAVTTPQHHPRRRPPRLPQRPPHPHRQHLACRRFVGASETVEHESRIVKQPEGPAITSGKVESRDPRRRHQHRIYADDVGYLRDQDRAIATGNVVHVAGQQPDLGRARRIQHQDAARHVLQRQRHRHDASRRAQTRARRHRAAADAGQETIVYFFGETIEKIGPKKYQIIKGGFTTCVQPTPRWDLRRRHDRRSTSITTRC